MRRGGGRRWEGRRPLPRRRPGPGARAPAARAAGGAAAGAAALLLAGVAPDGPSVTRPPPAPSPGHLAPPPKMVWALLQADAAAPALDFAAERLCMLLLLQPPSAWAPPEAWADAGQHAQWQRLLETSAVSILESEAKYLRHQFSHLGEVLAGGEEGHAVEECGTCSPPPRGGGAAAAAAAAAAGGGHAHGAAAANAAAAAAAAADAAGLVCGGSGGGAQPAAHRGGGGCCGGH
jgi:hypothetical protein